MTMFDRLPRQQMNPEAGMSQGFDMEEETPNNLTGLLRFLKGLYLLGALGRAAKSEASS